MEITAQGGSGLLSRPELTTLGGPHGIVESCTQDSIFIWFIFRFVKASRVATLAMLNKGVLQVNSYGVNQESKEQGYIP